MSLQAFSAGLFSKSRATAYTHSFFTPIQGEDRWACEWHISYIPACIMHHSNMQSIRHHLNNRGPPLPPFFLDLWPQMAHPSHASAPPHCRGMGAQPIAAVPPPARYAPRRQPRPIYRTVFPCPLPSTMNYQPSQWPPPRPMTYPGQTGGSPESPHQDEPPPPQRVSHIRHRSRPHPCIYLRQGHQRHP